MAPYVRTQLTSTVTHRVLCCYVVFLITAGSHGTAAVSSCWTNVTTSHTVLRSVYKSAVTCCDTWCNTYCSKLITQEVPIIEYIQTMECCIGYTGPNCAPICEFPCGLNQECASPNTCDCIKGWAGTSCRQVDELALTGTTSTSVEILWMIPKNTSQTHTAYVVSCYAEENESNVTKTVTATEDRANVSGLVGSVAYECCVTPTFMDGSGLKSCLKTITTSSGVLISIDEESKFTVRWTKTSNTQIFFYSFLLIKTITHSTLVGSWNISTTQMVSDSIQLDANIPYLFEEYVLSENSTIHLSSTAFFAEQTIPGVVPTITMATRKSPESLLIQWHPLSLEQSRGFITKYTVRYSESVVNCSYVEKIRTHSAKANAVILNDVNIQKDYCVSLSAATSVGSGDFTNYILIPVFDSSFFSVQMSGVYHCSKWVAENTITKLNNTEFELVKAINTKCTNCQYSSKYIDLLQFFCNSLQTNNDIVSFQGRILATTNISSDVLINLLQEWINSSPVIVVAGSRLRIIAQCSVRINQTGTTSCIVTAGDNSDQNMPCTTAQSNGNMDNSLHSLYLSLAGLILSTVALIVTMFGLLLFVLYYCSRRTINSNIELKPSSRDEQHTIPSSCSL